MTDLSADPLCAYRLHRVSLERPVSDAPIAIDPVGKPCAGGCTTPSHHASLRLGDAIVVAHAEVVGAAELLTTDARWKRFSKRVRVVN